MNRDRVASLVLVLLLVFGILLRGLLYLAAALFLIGCGGAFFGAYLQGLALAFFEGVIDRLRRHLRFLLVLVHERHDLGLIRNVYGPAIVVLLVRLLLLLNLKALGRLSSTLTSAIVLISSIVLKPRYTGIALLLFAPINLL